MFHLKTEGIKFIGDVNRQDAHMSVPIILAFDAVGVLSAPNTGFSIGKLAGHGTQPHFDEAFFDSIPFEDVYHDSPMPRSARADEIRNHRMSEVVFRGPLPVFPHLRYVVCRTRYDRTTLLHFLGDDAQRFQNMVVSEQTLGSMFVRYCTYIKGASASDGQLTLEFAPPRQPPAAGNFTVQVQQYNRGIRTLLRVYTWPADRTVGSMKDLPLAPDAVWQIDVDGCIAFKGTLTSTMSEVF
jgi:hypothetical protein